MSYRQQLRRDRAAHARTEQSRTKPRRVHVNDVIDGEPGEVLEVWGHIDDGTEDGTDMVLGTITVQRSGRLRVNMNRPKAATR